MSGCLRSCKSNSIFNVLNEKNVKRQPIDGRSGRSSPPLPDGSPSGLEVLPFAVPGKGAWYLEGKAHPAGGDGAGDTLGLRIADKASGKYFYFLAACARVTDDLKSRLAGAPLVFFDGTVWRDDELIVAGLGNKTGQGMGHISMSGDHGAIESLAGLDIGRKVFLHINNSNPAWLHGSAERKAAEARRLADSRRRNGDHAVNVDGHHRNDRAVDRQGHHAQQRRGAGGDAAPDRRHALSQPASVS